MAKKKTKKLIKKKVQYAPIHGVLLVVIVGFIAFFPSLSNGFCNYDDPEYVLNNALVQNFSTGLFTNFVHGNYHPLTMLSLAMNYTISGEHAFSYHLVNLLFHIASSICLFYICLKIFKKDNRFVISCFAALLFVAHPLHVESVAWVSERKDVLYVFFYLSAIYSYILYLNSQKNLHFSLCLLLFVLSLLSKGQAVSLAITLPLVDYLFDRKILSKKVLLEKVPFFILAFIFGYIALLAQDSSEAIGGVVKYPFTDRIQAAAYGFSMYLHKFLIPLKLACFYPYPSKIGAHLPAYLWLYSLPVLGYISVLYLAFRKKAKLLVFAMAFFITNIILLLQIIPVGAAIMADRYAYLASAGLCILFALFYSAAFEKFSNKALLLFFTFYIIVTTFMCNLQCLVWENSETLWEHALKVAPSAVAYTNMGLIINDKGKPQRALWHYDKALKLNPDLLETYNNMGVTLLGEKEYKEAIEAFDHFISQKETIPSVHSNKAKALFGLKKYEAAIESFKKVEALQADYPRLHFNFANSYFELNQFEKALEHYDLSIKKEQQTGRLYTNRGNCLSKLKKYPEALQSYNKAIAVEPKYKKAHTNKGIMLFYHLNLKDKACTSWQEAVKLGSVYAQNQLDKNCK